MQPSESIEPCPFCATPGAHPLEVDSDGWAMVCGTCGAIGPIGPQAEQARALWNARPAMPRGEDDQN